MKMSLLLWFLFLSFGSRVCFAARGWSFHDDERQIASEVVWLTNSSCVEKSCRLRDSATLTLLTSSCSREVCSVPSLITSDWEQLKSRKLAAYFKSLSSETLKAIVHVLDGIPVFTTATQMYKSSGLMDEMYLYEYGNRRKVPGPINLLNAVQKGSFGGIRGLNNGPIPKLSQLIENRSFRACTRELRRHSVGLRDEDLEKVAASKLNACFEDESDDVVADSRDELWDKAKKYNVVNADVMSLSAVEYVNMLWSEMKLETEYWISISWVPVFEELQDGLGHGDRAEVLLIELVETFLFDDIPNVSPVLVTRGGRRVKVKQRRLAALSACDDDDLESVISCVRRSVPNVYAVSQFVWSMGFAGNREKYSEVESDWNADEAYYGSGEFLPRYEDLEQGSFFDVAADVS